MSSPDYSPARTLGDDSFLLACSRSKWQGETTRCRWCDKPLTGRQQRWCSPDHAYDAYREHWWSAASKSVRTTRKHCERCGAAATDLGVLKRLEAHHVVPALGAHDRCSCLHHHDNVEVLCTDCHLSEHRSRRENERHPDALRLPI